MGRLDLILDDKIEKKFREKAAKLGHYKKGALSRAFETAIRQWLKNPSLGKLTEKKKTGAKR